MLDGAVEARQINAMLKRVASTLVSALLLSCSLTVDAAANEGTDQWSFNAALYVWLPSIGGGTATDSGVDADLGEFIDQLDAAFMGMLGARKQRWSFHADVIHLSVSGDEQGNAGLPSSPGPGFPAAVKVDIEGSVATFTGGYQVVGSYSDSNDSRNRIDLRFGARYLELDARLDFTIGSPTPQTLSLAGTDYLLDAIIGAHGRFAITDKWYLPYYVDVGTGDSNLTWQAFGGIGYAFRNIDLVAAYRYLEWDFDDSAVLDEVSFYGPFAGIQLRF